MLSDMLSDNMMLYNNIMLFINMISDKILWSDNMLSYFFFLKTLLTL
jgi:hypothetical protein